MKKAQLNLIDKAVAFLNPQGAVNRMIARQKLVNFSYDAVKYTRERKGPSSLSGAEDYHSNYDRVELMKRARDLAENVGLVRSILMKFASHTAANISYQARTENPEVNTEVEAYWAEWWDKCDLTTRHTGSTLMQVAMMSMLRDGDFLIVLVRDKDGNLKIQGIEADRLGDPFKVYTSLDLIGGIHIDRDTGAPSAYDIYNRSIGDFYTYQATIPSSQAFHLFDPLRIDQYRGISAFHTAINDATDIYDIINFEKMAAKNASSQAGIVKRNNNNASDLSSLTNDEDLNGNTIKLEAIESGKISYLEPGEDIIFPDGPSRPSGAFAEFHKILLRNICLGLGIPYSFAVDPSAMSGPTARLEMQQAGRTFRRYQKLLDDKVLRPIKNIVIADGVARGLIENNVGTRTTKGIFNFGANVSIDLGRESASAISEFKTGLRTAADIYAERGQDFESAMRQRAIEAKLIKDLAEKYGVAPETISDIVTPTPAPPQLPPAPAPKPVAPIGEEPEEGEDEGGDQKPIPEVPIDPSSEELEVKKKETDLEGNCGTGAGGFQPGNECSKGGGDGGKVIAYHGTSKEAAEKIDKYGYDLSKSTDGGMWLTPNKSIIEGKGIGAGQHGGIVERVIDESKLKLAGWKEYDKYVTDQLIAMGYDGVKLPSKEEGDSYKIFFPEKLTKVINKSKKLEALDCGTGAGGFKEGNTCAGGGGEEKIDKSNKASTKSPELWKLTKKEFFHPQISRKFIDAENQKDGTIIGNVGDLIHGEKTRELLKPVLDVPVMVMRTPVVKGERIKTGEDFVFDGASGTFEGKPAIFINPNTKMVGTLYEESAHQMRRATGREIKKADIKKIISGDGDFNKMYENDPEEISAKRMAKYIGTLASKEKDHEEIVRDALKAGKKVPQNVLKEYNLSTETAVVRELNQNEIKMLIEGMMGGIELAKYDGIDFTPPQGAREAAKRALDVRETKPPSQRGMTPVGIARARDLQNGVKLSPDTVRRMLNFLTRHEVDKKGATWDEQGKGWQAWNGWGGDAGYAWARKVVGQMEARDKKTEFTSESSDEVLNPCGQIDNGTFDKENTCAVGYGRPKLKGGYEPKRQASQPKEVPKGTNAPEPPKEPENSIDYNKERTRIADKISNNNKVKVDLPKDIKISQQIEKQYDNLLAKGYQIPPPETIGTLELTRKSRNAYAIARATYTPEGKLEGQSIYYNTKYDNNSKKGLISSVERNVEIKWLGTTDVLSHEYAHVLHKDIIPYEEARRYRRGKFGTGNVATERRKIAGEVSEYAQKNPMEFVAETFATHVNGKRHSKSVLEMYKFYRGPELK